MKKLITAKTIESLFNKGELRLELEAGSSIITPEAIDAAKNLGVEIFQKSGTKPSYSDIQKIIKEVENHFAGGKFSRAKIAKVVNDVLSTGK